ncbi:MAG TPA: enoyl-CoA hydratase-related protein [Bryobacteraceae bacterium]|nr:enoyl-CoA hydratase-related protein [Bryobacteraceae bacterium]
MNLERSHEGRLLRVTLARPEKRNALSEQLCYDLLMAFRDAESDLRVGAILLGARGEVFCAGMDLNEVSDRAAAERTSIHEQLFTIGSRITKPIVAAVKGTALAGGMGLVANAHVVVAAEDATFGLTEVRIGMWPFVVFRAVSLAIGERRALELSLTARIINAGDAHAAGLVHVVVPRSEVDERAAAIARVLSESSGDAIRTGIAFVNETRGLRWDEAGRLALQMREELFRSPDFHEGLMAFREKRKPEWPSVSHRKD